MKSRFGFVEEHKTNITGNDETALKTVVIAD